MQTLHSEQDLFAIVPGHDIPDLETVVASNDGYAIVRKHMEARRVEAVNELASMRVSAPPVGTDTMEWQSNSKSLFRAGAVSVSPSTTTSSARQTRPSVRAPKS